ncbi:MAG: Asp-tRNA(Asn)/Glu-tRNA(Gln) amidotransferase subunit GatC [Crenarchaeota archaeon]|nr:Asp-tRNA(Asn)/Glu-tRNA(Gln) amidotransferase subunit GatC [Thermoproteota archaeon]MDW8033383.1 Asp-tRNA(Asn)/Glu-tRNA(Gln) amidotransferase subunit GatC [Nitrososphaerota archaeon]
MEKTEDWSGETNKYSSYVRVGVQMDEKKVISKEEMLHYAKLCRISLSEQEIERLLKDINEILGYFETIRQLQLNVEPMTYVTNVNETLREDEPIEALSEEEVFRNAWEKEDRWFVSGQVWS